MAIRMRWSNTGADVIAPTPCAGTNTRSPITEPARKATHMHIMLTTPRRPA
jgi:hypothetical protein